MAVLRGMTVYHLASGSMQYPIDGKCIQMTAN